MKTITINEDTWQKLMIIKALMKARSIDEVVNRLIDKYYPEVNVIRTTRRS